MLKIVLLNTLIFSTLIWSQSIGVITGKVIDNTTKQPLFGVNIIVEESELGSASDFDGNFTIRNIPIGTHHIKVSMLGYSDRLFLNLPVTSARPINIVAELDAQPIKGEIVEVKSKAFTRSKSSTVSTMHVDQAEIRSDPGGVYDIQRVVQSLPSVTTASDQENEIISRGGLPGENLFLLDNIEIQNPNHFGSEGAGGGPVNMINPAFVREIEFTPGAFSAKYGDKASSVMDITLRDGSRNKLEIDTDLSMAGFGINLESPLFNGKGSLLASTKWSYLDLVVKSLGLTAVPKYSSHQLKAVYDLSPMNRLTFNYLLGFDEIHIMEENDVVSRGAENVDWKGKTDVAGLSLRTLLGNIGYGITTLSNVTLDQYTLVYRNGDRNQKYFTRNNLHLENTLKTDWTLKLGGFEVLTGLSAKQLDVGFDEWSKEDTIWIYDTDYWSSGEWIVEDLDSIKTDSPHQILPEWKFNSNDIAYKYAHYFELRKSLANKLNFRIGFRTDHFTETNETVYSPRTNIEFLLNPVSTLHLGIGRHYQYPANFIVFRDKNKNLKAKYSDQIVFGYEKYLDSDLRFLFETYYRELHNIPTHYFWSHPSDSLSDIEFAEHQNEWLNEGRGKGYGFEFFIQKKLMNNWHGLISYAWSHTQAIDVRNITSSDESGNASTGEKWYDWDFDIRHQITIIGGWKKKFHAEQWYSDLKQKSWYKVFSNAFGVINPLADEIELSFRFGYNSGRPYTEKQYRPETMQWLISDNAEWNKNRFPEYHRFDIMFLRRYHFRNLNLVTFIDVMNIYSRNNIWDYSYNSDGSKEEVWQYQTMPIGGFTIEF
ncbi:MAG: TonB-dependent receptor [Candidatus Marinimicrobia bacterium]|nr:TonB-dependent receptor [Candidatus Neomarinimicrobiota bacterium]MBL7023575.1 TonB-dependent receptor [Candidatus Neomarinimicrobiota bacterium]MBL7109775.1 TonB-dependent receptor [Candidatus Neomarinimicrobiota bacterium]